MFEGFGIGHFLMFITVSLYFLPSMIAAYRGHPRTGTIVFLNLLGFTWPVALIWAFNRQMGAR
jgi:hypothetical protein